MTDRYLTVFLPYRYEGDGYVITVITEKGNSLEGIEYFKTDMRVNGELLSQAITWDISKAMAHHREASGRMHFIMNLKFEDLPLHINSNDTIVKELCKLRLRAG